MGGRGSNSKLQTPIGRVVTTAQAVQQQPTIAQQPPTAQNTPVTPAGVTALTQMTDAQLAQLVRDSKTVDMPNFLADVSDATQKFVYAAGLNGKPTTLDDAAFAQWCQDNGVTTADLLSRDVDPITYTNPLGTRITLSGPQVVDVMRDSAFNYIGGKHGGQVYGAGTYFDKVGGGRTGYGSKPGFVTAVAALNPQTAHVISSSTLQTRARAFSQSHPQFARAVGGYSSQTMSIYALAMGYNVITSSGGYHNVIDRSALVYRRSTF